MGKSRAIREALSRPVHEDREEDGGDADHIGADVDRGSVHEEGRRGGGQVPHDPQVDILYGVLPRQRQREGFV